MIDGHRYRPARRSSRSRLAARATVAVAICLAFILVGATLTSVTVGTTSAQADDPLAAEASPSAGNPPVEGATDDDAAEQPPLEQEQVAAGDAGQASGDADQPPTETDQDAPPAAPADGTLDDSAPDGSVSDDARDATTSSSDSAVDQSSLEAPAPAPSLSYTPASRPTCKAADDVPEIVAQGAYLDYGCTYRLTLTGKDIIPAAIQLDWTVDAAVAGGWRVQLRPATLDSNNRSPWTDKPRATATLKQRGPIADDATSDITDALDTSADLAFRLRVYRVACGVEAQSVMLNLAVAASLPTIDGAMVQPTRAQSEPFNLRPALAPIPEPSVSFSGSLDFDDVAVDATGVKTPPTPRRITVTVKGLDQACGSWRLSLKASPLSGTQNASIDAGNLHLSTIDDEPLPDGACPLDGGCRVAVLAAGPDADPVATFNLGVSLVLPDQPRATTFNATLTASLTEAHS
jgi:hypothetical protein